MCFHTPAHKQVSAPAGQVLSDEIERMEQADAPIAISTNKRIRVIGEFSTNLQNSLCMGDRRDSILWLAKEIGRDDANAVAKLCGLDNSFSFV